MRRLIAIGLAAALSLAVSGGAGDTSGGAGESRTRTARHRAGPSETPNERVRLSAGWQVAID